jgi:hypothetical protein
MIGTLSTGQGYIQQQRFDGTATAYNLFLQPNGGDVGIGTTSPSSKIHVQRSDDGTIATFRGTSSAQLLLGIASGNLVYDSSNGNATHVFQSNTTERARIDSSGNLLVGRTSQVSTEKFSVESSGDTYVAFFKGGSSAQYSQGIWNPATSGDNLFTVFATEGSLTPRGSISYNRAGGLVAYNVTSDYRAKDIAGAISDASSTVLSLKPYMGTMKGAEIARPMFVAHETQEIAPYAVTGQKDAVDNDGNAVYQQMDHSALVPLLTAALQEALTEIASLKGRLDAANL